MAKIELGSEVKDRVTGYTGIAVSVTTFLTGCDRYAVQKKYNPEKDDKPAEVEMYDEVDLEVIGRGILPPPPEPKPEPRRTTGGNPSFKPEKTR